MNWLEVLKNPPVVGGEAHLEMCGKAGEWPTCACGELDEGIPRGLSGRPSDPVLEDLGLGFYRAVCRGRWSQALNTLWAIDFRAAMLLRGDERDCLLRTTRRGWSVLCIWEYNYWRLICGTYEGEGRRVDTTFSEELATSDVLEQMEREMMR